MAITETKTETEHRPIMLTNKKQLYRHNKTGNDHTTILVSKSLSGRLHQTAIAECLQLYAGVRNVQHVEIKH